MIIFVHIIGIIWYISINLVLCLHVNWLIILCLIVLLILINILLRIIDFRLLYILLWNKILRIKTCRINIHIYFLKKYIISINKLPLIFPFLQFFSLKGF